MHLRVADLLDPLDLAEELGDEVELLHGAGNLDRLAAVIG